MFLASWVNSKIIQFEMLLTDRTVTTHGLTCPILQWWGLHNLQ